MTDSKAKPQSYSSARNALTTLTPKGAKQICIPMERGQYNEIWHDSPAVRDLLDSLIAESPELFPPSIQQGYQLSGHLPESRKMPGIRLRQIRMECGVYSLRPSFVMSYMSGTVDEMESALLLLSVNNPCWVVTQTYGHDDMFWYRHLERLGRNSLVGTTVPMEEHVPVNLVADEHHCDWVGEKGYVAFTAGGGCILGLGLSVSADEAHLTKAYRVFAQEVHELAQAYEPKTVNTDGWWATQNAFVALFPTIVPILCFLHGFLKIRDRGRKLHELHQRIWDVYYCDSKETFSQAMAQFKVWFEEGTWSQAVTEAVEKLCKRVDQYALSYDYPNSHRTSNLVDRLMNRLTRYLYAGRGLHGYQLSSELRLRGWALLNNFRPFAPRGGQTRPFQSPAHRLNQKQYHPNWLHNLQICSSCQGFRNCT